MIDRTRSLLPPELPIDRIGILTCNSNTLAECTPHVCPTTTALKVTATRGVSQSGNASALTTLHEDLATFLSPGVNGREKAGHWTAKFKPSLVLRQGPLLQG